MFDRLALPSLDIQALLRRLSANPLLMALFLISPPDALNYLGLGLFAGLFQDMRATTAGDLARVTLLTQALNQGRTSLDKPQIVQSAALVKKRPPHANTQAAAAIEHSAFFLGVSKESLQHMLALYTKHGFHGQEFSLPTQRWGEVHAVGDTLSLDLLPGQARIIATFQAQLHLRLALPLGVTIPLGSIDSPFVFDMQTTVSFDHDSVLCMDIRQGEIRLSKVPLPEVIAQEMARQLVTSMPTIPLLKMPTRFELPGADETIVGALDLKASGIQIRADGVRLGFHLV